MNARDALSRVLMDALCDSPIWADRHIGELEEHIVDGIADAVIGTRDGLARLIFDAAEQGDEWDGLLVGDRAGRTRAYRQADAVLSRWKLRQEGPK